METTRWTRAALAALLVTAPAALANADATVESFRVDARGEVAGVILDDGTELVSGPTIPLEVRLGDAVRVLSDPTGSRLLDLRTGRTTDLISTATATAPAAPRSPARGAALAPAAPQLARGGGPLPTEDVRILPYVARTARVARMLHTPDGTPTGFATDDRVQVRVVPRAAVVLSRLRPGETVSVEGRGMWGSYGLGMWATRITRPDGSVVLDLGRGPLAPEMALTRPGDVR